jgi:hypothetical protein
MGESMLNNLLLKKGDMKSSFFGQQPAGKTVEDQFADTVGEKVERKVQGMAIRYTR